MEEQTATIIAVTVLFVALGILAIHSYREGQVKRK